MKFEMFKGKNGEFYFRLKAKNGQIILASEGYKNKAGAENSIMAIQKNGQDQTKFEWTKSKNKKWYFNLKAANGQTIGTSQMYATKRGMQGGIASVMRNAKAPTVEKF